MFSLAWRNFPNDNRRPIHFPFVARISWRVLASYWIWYHALQLSLCRIKFNLWSKGMLFFPLLVLTLAVGDSCTYMISSLPGKKKEKTHPRLGQVRQLCVCVCVWNFQRPYRVYSVLVLIGPLFLCLMFCVTLPLKIILMFCDVCASCTPFRHCLARSVGENNGKGTSFQIKDSKLNVWRAVVPLTVTVLCVTSNFYLDI